LQEQLLSLVNAYGAEPNAQRKRDLDDWIRERAP
jgi:hypothetical protein